MLQAVTDRSRHNSVGTRIVFDGIAHVFTSLFSLGVSLLFGCPQLCKDFAGISSQCPQLSKYLTITFHLAGKRFIANGVFTTLMCLPEQATSCQRQQRA
ncbi:hypothetical protein [Kluyvera sichuanensis]|uniref:hypothetical protein n=1 Tax=Kluyvera sichuanensis TaxID=2725494 RepID=UPI0039F49631